MNNFIRLFVHGAKLKCVCDKQAAVANLGMLQGKYKKTKTNEKQSAPDSTQ